MAAFGWHCSNDRDNESLKRSNCNLLRAGGLCVCPCAVLFNCLCVQTACMSWWQTVKIQCLLQSVLDNISNLHSPWSRVPKPCIHHSWVLGQTLDFWHRKSKQSDHQQESKLFWKCLIYLYKSTENHIGQKYVSHWWSSHRNREATRILLRDLNLLLCIFHLFCLCHAFLFLHLFSVFLLG